MLILPIKKKWFDMIKIRFIGKQDKKEIFEIVRDVDE